MDRMILRYRALLFAFLIRQSLSTSRDAILRETKATALVQGNAKCLRRLRDLLPSLLINFLRVAECYDDAISGRTVIETITDKTARYQERTAICKITLLLPVLPTRSPSSYVSPANSDDTKREIKIYTKLLYHYVTV